MRYGPHYTPEETTWRVWAPGHEDLALVLETGEESVSYEMQREEQGEFAITLSGDYHLIPYRYRVGDRLVVDPYSQALSYNGRQSVVVDLKKAEPAGWAADCSPAISPEEAVIYELHVKDYSFDPEGGFRHCGKYLGLTETGLTLDGSPVGLDHLKRLGITHVHLMPVMKFYGVDEHPAAFDREEEYNWGYNPLHYFVPEGSYATDPHDPLCRIRELRTLVAALHQAGFKVVLDVVYNHTYFFAESPLEILAPGEYYRLDDQGRPGNGSGCGNELATERDAVKELILSSLLFWQSQYHIDGFRFDLMGLMDTETADLIVSALRHHDPEVLLYGEPWAAQASLLPQMEQVQLGTQRHKGYSLFHDDFRNAIKGDNDGAGCGFIQGVENGAAIAAGATIYGGIGPFAEPWEAVQYFNSHDNLILEDKLQKSSPHLDDTAIQQETLMAFALILLARGIPFIHEGNEFRRSKQGQSNTYRAPIGTNMVRWRQCVEEDALVEAVASLIALRQEMGRAVIAGETKATVMDTAHPAQTGWVLEDEMGGAWEIYVNNGKKPWAPLDLERELTEQRTLKWDGKTKVEEIYHQRHLVIEPQTVMVFYRESPF